LELECPFQGTSERLFALKRINLPNGWHDAAPSLGHAVWVEASRLAWCASYEVQFNAQAAYTSTVVYGQSSMPLPLPPVLLFTNALFFARF